MVFPSALGDFLVALANQCSAEGLKDFTYKFLSPQLMKITGSCLGSSLLTLWLILSAGPVVVLALSVPSSLYHLSLSYLLSND